MDTKSHQKDSKMSPGAFQKHSKKSFQKKTGKSAQEQAKHEKVELQNGTGGQTMAAETRKPGMEELETGTL